MAKTIRPQSDTDSNNDINDNMSTFRPDENTSTYRPDENTSTYRPDENTSTYRPDENISTYRPDENASTYRPDENASTYRPDENISTYRPDENASTYRPDENISTYRPDENSSTVRPDEDVSTYRPDEDAVPQSVHDVASIAAANRLYEPTYEIDNEIYEVEKILSSTSGEALVLLVTNNGLKYVLKLYYEGVVPNHKILNIIKRLRSAKMLFGVISHGQIGNRHYELMDYYSGPNLDSLDVRGNEKEIEALVAKMFVDVDFCHRNGFIHRDIKPSNFMFEDPSKNKLMLGDFGISVECGPSGKCQADMARTKIFAAPEVYVGVGDGKVNVSTKSDYYSLGIIILYLWMGHDRFHRFEKENELALATMKNYGTLPMPDDMPVRLLALVKALIHPNPDDRPDFELVVKWLKGENPFKAVDSDASDFRVVFSARDNLIAYSPEELAQIMLSNTSLALTYLYRGKISEWVQQNNQPELSVEIDRLIEEVYPKDQKAGLEAACYVLDQSLPYRDITGKQCASANEIARSVYDNMDVYAHELTGKDEHRLFVFMRTHGLEALVNETLTRIKKDPHKEILNLIYLISAGRKQLILFNILSNNKLLRILSCRKIHLS